MFRIVWLILSLSALLSPSGLRGIALPAPTRCPSGLAWDGKSIWNVDFQTDSLYRIDLAELPPFQVADYRMVELEFVHRLENLGPGTVKSGQIAIAVPTNSPPDPTSPPSLWPPAPPPWLPSAFPVPKGVPSSLSLRARQKWTSNLISIGVRNLKPPADLESAGGCFYSLPQNFL